MPDTVFSILAALAIAPASVVPQAGDPVGVAKTFLQTLLTKPSATQALVTSDAFAVVGDIGGPYSGFLKATDAIAAMGTCVVGDLQQTAPRSKTELQSYPTPSLRAAEKVAIVKAALTCPLKGGANAVLDVQLMLTDGHVAIFGLQSRR